MQRSRGTQPPVGGVQQGMGLRGALDVAAKENHSAGPQQAQPGSFHGAQLRAFQAHHQNLAGRLSQGHELTNSPGRESRS